VSVRVFRIGGERWGDWMGKMEKGVDIILDLRDFRRSGGLDHSEVTSRERQSKSERDRPGETEVVLL